MKTVVSYVYYETRQSIYNLDFFAQVGIFESDDVVFIIVINGLTCSVELPNYKNCIIIKRPNTGYDFGGHNASIQHLLKLHNVSSTNDLPFDNYIFMNSGVIGPFLSPAFPSNLTWLTAFTSKLNDKVKLVGTTIVCFKPGRLEGQGPHVEGFCFCLDKIGLDIAIKKETIFTDHIDKTAAITNGEYGLSKAIIAKGYTLDCLLYKYQNVDWNDTMIWPIVSDGEFQSRCDSYDGISIHPFEVVFHKWYWAHHPHRTVSFNFVSKYKKWKQRSLNRSKLIYASYGTTDYNINVTNKCIEHFSNNDKMVIPENFNFSTIFPDIFKIIEDPECHLYLTINNNQYTFRNININKFEFDQKESIPDGSITAFYGTIDLKVDVTSKLLCMFKKDKKIIIPKTFVFNECFGDTHPGKLKSLFLYMNSNNKKYVINEKHYKDLEFDIYPLESNTTDMTSKIENTINIVYFINMNQIGWLNIVAGQLIQLKKTGLLKIAKLYVHINSNNTGDSDLAQNLITSIVGEATISVSSDNNEYMAIHLIWQLAKKNPNAFYLYFHSKTMSQSSAEKSFEERILFQEVICQWRKVINVFNTEANINKIGFASTNEGCMWFNFWWARGTYLNDCDEPINTKDDFYYDKWLYQKNNNSSKCTDCYSLADNISDKYYNSDEVSRALTSVPLLVV